MNPIDIGWMKYEESDKFNPDEDIDPDSTDHLFFNLFNKYYNIRPLLEKNISSAKYEFNSNWYISELEEILRYGLCVHKRMFIESPPYISIEDYYSGIQQYNFVNEISYSELFSKVQCNCTFFKYNTIRLISELVGDALEKKEIILLPSFSVEIDDEDEDDRVYYEATDYFSNFSTVWEYMVNCQTIQTNKNSDSVINGKEIGLPVFINGNIKDLIKLRRDEGDTFLQWRKYLDEVLNLTSVTEREISESLNQGLSELKGRISILEKKGILDIIGTTAFFTGISFAYYNDEMGMISASAATIAGGTQSIKLLQEVREERRRLKQEPFYFLWLVNQLPS